MMKAIKFAAAAVLALPAIVRAQGTQPPPAAAPAAPAAPAAQQSLSQGFGVYVFPAKQQTKEVQDKDERCRGRRRGSLGSSPGEQGGGAAATAAGATGRGEHKERVQQSVRRVPRGQRLYREVRAPGPSDLL